MRDEIKSGFSLSILIQSSSNIVAGLLPSTCRSEDDGVIPRFMTTLTFTLYQNNHNCARKSLFSVHNLQPFYIPLVSRPSIRPPIRIPFHQFAPNQVTNSHSEEIGGFGNLLRNSCFWLNLKTFRFRLWSKTSNWQMVFQM